MCIRDRVRYFEDEDRYADLINGFIFDGERVVSGDDIQELDSRITGFLSKIKDGFKIQKYRESVRKEVYKRQVIGHHVNTFFVQ